MFRGRVFVPPAEVYAKLGQIKCVDARFRLADAQYGFQQFTQSRLPGAVFADVDTDLSEIDASKPARHPLPVGNRFVSWCLEKNLGLSDPPEPIVCYDEMSGGMGAARAWWMLDQVGLEAYILDGGFPRWCDEELPLEIGKPNAQQRLSNVNVVSLKMDQWRHSKLLKEETLKDIEDDGAAGCFLVDSRPQARYDSVIRPEAIDALPGHMPGAVNCPWPNTLVEVEAPKAPEKKSKEFREGFGLLGKAPEDLFKKAKEHAPTFHQLAPEEVLRKNFDEVFKHRPAEHKNRTIFYCGSGVTACQNLAALSHLERNNFKADMTKEEIEAKPKLYGGSFSEYSGVRFDDISRRIMLHHGALIHPVRSNPTGKYVAQLEAETGEFQSVSVDGKWSFLKDVEPRVLRGVLFRELRIGEKLEVGIRSEERMFECMSRDEE